MGSDMGNYIQNIRQIRKPATIQLWKLIVIRAQLEWYNQELDQRPILVLQHFEIDTSVNLKGLNRLRRGF
jgi:hypothetical protein